MAVRCYLCFILLYLGFSCTNGDNTKSLLVLEKETLDAILNTTSYDARIRPLENDNVLTPTKVTVNMYLRVMTRFEDTRMQYNAQILLRQKWVDSRLRYDNLGGKLNSINVFEEKIWTPDLFVANEFSGYINNLMKPNKFIRIYPDGKVLYSARLSLVLSCPMNFQLYPFDMQICPMRFESFGFTTDDVLYQWEDYSPVMVAKDLNFAHYTLQKFQTETSHDSLSSGRYVSLEVNFYLKRKLTYHLFHLFLPTMLLVVTSWVTFWLDRQAIMTRLFVVLTTLLVLGYKVSDFNASLPPVSYLKSVDIWTGTCLIFVFASLLVVLTVDYRSREQLKKQRRATGVLGTTEDENTVNIDLNTLVSNTSSNVTENFQQLTRTGRLRNFFCRRLSTLPSGPKRMDIISRVLFPLSFLLFNVFYWFVNLVCYAVE